MTAMTETAFALEWEKLANEGSETGLVTERARVFGGWLVRMGIPGAMALAFVPDGEGRWDGEDFGEDDYEYEEDEEEESDEESDDAESDEASEEDDD
jgi:hypothetical protein